MYNSSIGDTVRRNVFRGINTTIMSYGQKGSGKSYTMFGPEKKKYNKHDINVDDDISIGTSDTTSTYNSVHGTFGEDGVVPRAIHDLFMAKDKQSTGGEVNILMTFVEIYNDGIVDLLTYKKAKGKQLIIRDNIGVDGNAGGATIRGVTSIKLKSSSHARHLVNAALKRRLSARSHIICTLNVTINPAVKSSVTSGKLASMTSTDVITAKLTLVDLAGSEQSKNGHVDQKEDGCISKDMLVLSKCIHALTDKKGKVNTPSKLKHVPFRDCKLTRVLRDSLGGNCCTIMLACVSPYQDDVCDSLSTLRIAESSREITNYIKKNYVKKISLTSAEGAALRKENKILKSHVLDMTRKMHTFQRGTAQKTEIVFDIDNELEGLSDNKATDINTWRLKYEKLCNLCRETNVSIDDTVELTTEDKSLLKSHEDEINELTEQISQLMSCHTDDGASITSGITMGIGDFDDHSLGPSVATILSLSNLTVKSCEHIDKEKMAEIEDTKTEQKLERMKAKSVEPQHEVQTKGDDRILSGVIDQQQHLLKSINDEIAIFRDTLKTLKDEQQALDKCAEGSTKSLQEKQQSCDEVEIQLTSLKAQVKSLSNEKLALVEEVEDFQNIADLIAELSFERESKVSLQAKLDCAVKDADSMRVAILDLQIDLKSQRKLFEEESEMRKRAESREATLKATLKEFEEELEEQKTNQSLAVRVSELEAMMQAQGNEKADSYKHAKDQSRPPLAKKRKNASSDGDSVVSITRLLKDYEPKRQKTVDEANTSILFGGYENESIHDFNASFDNDSVAFSTGANSLSSEQRAIRLHAQKLLFWADKATGTLDNSSMLSLSVDKENAHDGRFPTFTTPVKNKSREGLKNAARSHNRGPSPIRNSSFGLKDAVSGRSKSQSMSPSTSHVSSVQHEKSCSCSGSLFSGNKEHSEFFLPKLGMACNCGGAEKKAKSENEDPTALKSFLRTWQVSFLRSMGIFSADDIIYQYSKHHEEMARAMKHWRYSKRMKPARTKACLVALQIWTKTAKTVLRSNKKYARAIQRSATTPIKYTKPNFLEIAAEDNDEVSIMSMEEFPNDVLFEGEFEI